jgi:short-subunit dehydrogenase
MLSPLETLRRTIVITGGGRGIGAALARHYASPHVRLVLIGRNSDHLHTVADECRGLGADVQQLVIDVTDAPALAQALQAVDAITPVDILIANAGISTGQTVDGGCEPADAAGRVIRVNLEGVVNTVAPLVERMRQRGGGRIALISSLAGLLPLPDSPSYSASKAGVISYGLALDTFVRPSGVSVTVLCPGFVTSDMSARFSGSKPFLLAAEDAACKMALAIERRARLVAFPWQLATVMKLTAALPYAVRSWLLQRLARFSISCDKF